MIKKNKESVAHFSLERNDLSVSFRVLNRKKIGLSDKLEDLSINE